MCYWRTVLKRYDSIRRRTWWMQGGFMRLQFFYKLSRANYHFKSLKCVSFRLLTHQEQPLTWWQQYTFIIILTPLSTPSTLCILHFTLRHCTYPVKSIHCLCVLDFCREQNYGHIRIMKLNVVCSLILLLKQSNWIFYLAIY